MSENFEYIQDEVSPVNTVSNLSMFKLKTIFSTG
uniref:Uncharacterized protein n=1 Tax=Heterorhabditis bacteriophora TaxID=37862 RepID=A0A1I7XEW4_HETBA